MASGGERVYHRLQERNNTHAVNATLTTPYEDTNIRTKR